MIIPILLYHGKERWEYRTLGDLFKNLEPEWKQFLPDFDFVYNNLGELSDEQVEALNNKFLVASLLALKHTFEKEWLEANVLRLMELSDHAPENLQSSLIVYTFERSGLKEEQIITIIKSLPTTVKNTIMSTLDVFVEKGRQEEREKAIRNLVRISQLTDVQIASAFEVPQKYVARVRSEINNAK